MYSVVRVGDSDYSVDVSQFSGISVKYVFRGVVYMKQENKNKENENSLYLMEEMK